MRRSRGNALVTTVLVLALLLAFGAVLLNAGHLASVKGELQNGVDAAALSGAAQLSGTADQITPDGASPTFHAAQGRAAAHFTDEPAGYRIAADQVLLGEWRAAARPGCEAGDFLTAFHDSGGAHFCEVRARDAAAAFRINAVYARAQRAPGAPGGGPIQLFMSRFLRSGATFAQGAEALAITGGPQESSCLEVPMVIGVGCLTGTGGSACASDAPPDSAGPLYTLGLSPTPVRSAGWSVFDSTNPSQTAICTWFKTVDYGCWSVALGSYIQVDVGQGNKFNGGCRGDLGEQKTCDWFKPFARRAEPIEVPVISMSGDLTESCPSNYTGNAWVVGYSTLRVLAVNCSANVHTPDCVGPACADLSAPCNQYAASQCVLTQLVCNHRSGARSTGGAWTGTSPYHPVLVQTRGAAP